MDCHSGRPDFVADPDHDQKTLRLAHIETGGKVFPDGRSLSLLKNPATEELELLLSDGKNLKVAQHFEIDGRMYVPPILGASTLAAVVFPTNTGIYESTEQLFSAIEEFLDQHGFPHEVAFPAVSWVFTTLFPECLPPAHLLITGSRAESCILLRLLACVVRHALPLVQIEIGTFSYLPMVLRPTLVIDHQSPGRALSRLISSSSAPGAFLARKGELTDISCAKAIYAGPFPSPLSLGDAVVHLNVLPSHASRLIFDQHAQDEIARELQAKLLTYRAMNIGKVRDSDFDAPGLDSAHRILAAVLGRSIVDAPAIQERVMSICQSQQETIRTDRWVDPSCVAIESVIFHSHSGKDVIDRRLHIGTVAATTERILQGRGEETRVTPKAMGIILRGFGFRDQRDRRGYWIDLTNEVRRQAHILARDLGVPASNERASGCSQCAAIFGDSSGPNAQIK